MHSPHPTHAGTRVDARPASVGSRWRMYVLAQPPEATKAAPPEATRAASVYVAHAAVGLRASRSSDAVSGQFVDVRTKWATCVQCTQSAQHAQRTPNAPQASRAGAVDESVRACTSAVCMCGGVRVTASQELNLQPQAST